MAPPAVVSRPVIHCAPRHDPRKWDLSVVKALHSRSVGIKTDIGLRCSDVNCRSCERCVTYEHEILEYLNSRVSRPSTINRATPRSQQSQDIYIAGVKTPKILQHRLSAPLLHSTAASLVPTLFTLLSPPSKQQEISDLAVRIHFVAACLRKFVERRLRRLLGLVETFEEDNRWYISEGDFEELLFASGVTWLTRAQTKNIYKIFDLNDSGNLHISELADVVTALQNHVHRIIRGESEISQPEFRRSDLTQLFESDDSSPVGANEENEVVPADSASNNHDGQCLCLFGNFIFLHFLLPVLVGAFGAAPERLRLRGPIATRLRSLGRPRSEETGNSHALSVFGLLTCALAAVGTSRRRSRRNHKSLEKGATRVIRTEVDETLEIADSGEASSVSIAAGASVVHRRSVTDTAGLVHVRFEGPGGKYKLVQEISDQGQSSLEISMHAANCDAEISEVLAARGRESEISSRVEISVSGEENAVKHAVRVLAEEGGVAHWTGGVHIAGKNAEISQQVRALTLSKGQTQLTPSLEIRCKELRTVKHGVALKEALDRDGLLLLRSRGLGKPQAEETLKQAFLHLE